MKYKILITGGAGYVGAVLVPKLLMEGHTISVVDLFMYGDNVLPNHERLKKHKLDIRNISEINKIEKFGKDTYQVVLKNGVSLKVSRSRYQELKMLLGV